MSKSKKRALELLLSPYFFFRLLRTMRKTGLVGEQSNALATYIVATSRLLETPLCLFIKGPSGVGKNFLADTVLGFLPRSEVHPLTSSSLRGWNYWGKKLAHKTVYLRERNEAAGPVDPTRLLISEKKLEHFVTVKKGGRFVPKRYVTEGPIAAISTTTKKRVEVDDETRHLSLALDETPTQTTRIMEAAVKQREGLKASEKKIWHEVQRLIQKRSGCRIELPDWFEDLVLHVRNDNLWARRYFPAFLQACKTVALIRSFSRTTKTATKPKSIVVRFTDFAVTALIFNSVFNQSIDRADDVDLEVQQRVRQISIEEDGEAVSADDLAKDMGISDDRAYRLLRNAASAGTIFQANQPPKTNLKLYLPAKPGPFLPDPAEIFTKLESLPERVKFVHPLTGEWVTYSRNRREDD